MNTEIIRLEIHSKFILLTISFTPASNLFLLSIGWARDMCTVARKRNKCLNATRNKYLFHQHHHIQQFSIQIKQSGGYTVLRVYGVLLDIAEQEQ